MCIRDSSGRMGKWWCLDRLLQHALPWSAPNLSASYFSVLPWYQWAFRVWINMGTNTSRVFNLMNQELKQALFRTDHLGGQGSLARSGAPAWVFETLWVRLRYWSVRLMWSGWTHIFIFIKDLCPVYRPFCNTSMQSKFCRDLAFFFAQNVLAHFHGHFYRVDSTSGKLRFSS